MYILKTEHSFDSAHFLADYEGKCSNIHGHRWRIELEIMETKLQESGQQKGMCVDFSNLKKDLRFQVDKLDHCLIIEQGSLRQKTYDALLEDNFKIISVPFRPTAENFAKYFFDVMKEMGYNVKNVTVYETPSNSASYCE